MKKKKPSKSINYERKNCKNKEKKLNKCEKLIINALKNEDLPF